MLKFKRIAKYVLEEEMDRDQNKNVSDIAGNKSSTAQENRSQAVTKNIHHDVQPPPIKREGECDPYDALHPAMRWSYEEKTARAEEKVQQVLNFLGSGETWSTLAVITALLRTSEQTARRLLKRLQKELFVKVDDVYVNGGQLKIYGITKLGLMAAENAHELCTVYEVGRLSASIVRHYTSIQMQRIILEQKSNFSKWVPEKILLARLPRELREGTSIPDAIANSEIGFRFAIEIELNLKSETRMLKAVQQHIASLESKRYIGVLYFTDKVPQLKHLLAKVGPIENSEGEEVSLSETEWYKWFVVCTLGEKF